LSEPKEKYFLTAAEIKTLKESVDLDRVLHFLQEERVIKPGTTWESVPFYRPKPIDSKEDGFKGRIGIYEVLKMSAAIKEIIMRSGTAEEIEEQGKKEGMTTMIEDGIFKAAQGLTTIEEVLRVITE